jgi:hypothetical protein
MRRSHNLLAALVAVLLAAAPLPAGAASLSFVQRGFTDGAELRLDVEGSDLNADGFLERGALNPIDEITGFSLVFSGNSLIAPFSLGLSELLIFGVDLTSLDFLGLDGIVFAGNDQVAYVAGASAGADCVGIFLCGVLAAIELDLAAFPLLAVPEPPGLWVFGLALPPLLLLRRRYMPSARR